MWVGLSLYVLLLVFAYGLLSYMERAAAMRGSHRKPLASWVDKSLRVVFLMIYAVPVLMLWPIVGTVLLLLYAPTYLDGAEKLSPSLKHRFEKHGRYLRNWYPWRWLAKRWNLKLKKSADLPSGTQYIFGMHPHGVLPFGGMVNMCTDVTGRFDKVLPDLSIRTLAASFCFYVPLYRDLILAGGVIDAARFNAQAALKGQDSLLLYPGGATEALYSGPGRNVVVVRKRLGFVRLALETGASLVPCYTFGENDGFAVLSDKGMPSWLNQLRNKWQAVFGFSLPLITSIVPRKANMCTVLGKPIPVPKVDQPSREQVLEYLDKYIAGLEELFQEHAPEHDKGSELTVL